MSFALEGSSSLNIRYNHELRRVPPRGWTLGTLIPMVKVREILSSNYKCYTGHIVRDLCETWYGTVYQSTILTHKDMSEYLYA